jgi:hypothetical protein
LGSSGGKLCVPISARHCVSTFPFHPAELLSHISLLARNAVGKETPDSGAGNSAKGRNNH